MAALAVARQGAAYRAILIVRRNESATTFRRLTDVASLAIRRHSSSVSRLTVAARWTSKASRAPPTSAHIGMRPSSGRCAQSVLVGSFA
eukprot:scaffold72072_cov43-Phaeocystis_antarctica.AAC.5